MKNEKEKESYKTGGDYIIKDACIKNVHFEKKTSSPIYIQVNYDIKMYLPLYLKVFFKEGQSYYNAVGEEMFYDHSKCFIIYPNVKYFCPISFQKTSKEYVILIYDDKGEQVTNCDLIIDVNDEVMKEIKEKCRFLKQKDLTIKGYDSVIDRLYEGPYLFPERSSVEKPTTPQETSCFSPAPSTCETNESFFFIIEVPGPFMIHLKLLRRQTTNQIYNFVRSMSEVLACDSSFLIMDFDNRVKVPRNGLLKEVFHYPNKSRFRLKVFTSFRINEKSIVKLDLNVEIDDESYFDTTIEEKTSADSISIYVDELSCPFYVSAYGKESMNSKEIKNLTYMRGYRECLIVSKPGKTRFFNHIGEDGYSFCFLRFKPTEKGKQYLHGKWCPGYINDGEEMFPTIHGELMKRPDGLNPDLEVDYVESEVITLELKDRERVRTNYREKHIWDHVMLNVISLDGPFLVQVRAGKANGPNECLFAEKGKKAKYSDGFKICEPGKYNLPNMIQKDGFIYCYLEFRQLTNEDQTISFTWSPGSKERVPYAESVFFNDFELE